MIVVFFVFTISCSSAHHISEISNILLNKLSFSANGLSSEIIEENLVKVIDRISVSGAGIELARLIRDVK